MRGRWPIFSRASDAVPALTAGLLVVLPLVFPNHTTVDAAGLARQEAVRAAVREAPYRIGHWVGADIPVPPAAVELLHPNAILSRRFQRIGGGPNVSLLLVHCTDARDMRGHYPPVCYPSSGWSIAGVKRSRQAVLMVNGRRMPVRVYEFRRIEGDGRESRIRVFNVFVLPDGTLTPNIDQINRLAERLALATRGLAQMQIVTPSGLNDEEAAAAAGEILEGMSGPLTALGVWREGDDV